MQTWMLLTDGKLMTYFHWVKLSLQMTPRSSLPPLAQLCERPSGPERPAGCSPPSPERQVLPDHLDMSLIWSSEGETHTVTISPRPHVEKMFVPV